METLVNAISFIALLGGTLFYAAFWVVMVLTVLVYLWIWYKGPHPLLKDILWEIERLLGRHS